MAEAADIARKSIGARRNPDSADAIREAAEALLLERGYAGFSDRRAHAGKPTIYRWWPSKAALLLDVYQRQKRDIDYGETDSVEEDMFRFLRSLLTPWRDTPTGHIFRSLVAEAQSDPAAAAALGDYARDRREHRARMIERAIARGEVRRDVDPVIVADLLASYAWAHLMTGRLDESDDTIRAVARLIARGIVVGPDLAGK